MRITTESIGRPWVPTATAYHKTMESAIEFAVTESRRGYEIRVWVSYDATPNQLHAVYRDGRRISTHAHVEVS